MMDRTLILERDQRCSTAVKKRLTRDWRLLQVNLARIRKLLPLHPKDDVSFDRGFKKELYLIQKKPRYPIKECQALAEQTSGEC